MFQLLPCSICQRTFSLRKDVAEDTLLKCPNCGNQFRLGDVLDAFYGPWIVLDDVPNDKAESERPVGAPTDSKLSFENLLNTHEADPSNLLARSNAVTDHATEFAADNVFEAPAAFTNNDLGDDLELDQLEAAEPNTFDMPSELTLDDGSLSEDPTQPTLGLEDRMTSSAVNENQPGLAPFGSDNQNQPGLAPFGSDNQSQPGLAPFGSDNQSQPGLAPFGSVKKPRARKGDKGGLWSIIQVVLGGAAAIPVTLLLLWYGLGKDIAGAGPAIAQFAPWIVPQKLRSPAENLPVSTGPRVPPPALGEGGFRDFEAELNAMPNESTESGTQVTAQNSDTQETTSTSTNTDSSTSAPVEDTRMEDAFATSNRAKQTIKQWDPTSADKAQVIADLFADLVGLSEQMSNFPAGGGAMNLLRNDLKEIGRFIVSDSVRVEFAKLQQKQFDAQSPPTRSGRILLSWAKEVTETESHWIVKHPDLELKIEVPKQSVTQLPPGQKFFCMGTLIDESESANDASAPKMIRISASFFQTF